MVGMGSSELVWGKNMNSSLAKITMSFALGRSRGREVFFSEDSEKLKALSGELYLQNSAWEK